MSKQKYSLGRKMLYSGYTAPLAANSIAVTVAMRPFSKGIYTVLSQRFDFIIFLSFIQFTNFIQFLDIIIKITISIYTS